jgi:hypothetical protein
MVFLSELLSTIGMVLLAGEFVQGRGKWFNKALERLMGDEHQVPVRSFTAAGSRAPRSARSTPARWRRKPLARLTGPKQRLGQFAWKVTAGRRSRSRQSRNASTAALVGSRSNATGARQRRAFRWSMSGAREICRSGNLKAHCVADHAEHEGIGRRFT